MYIFKKNMIRLYIKYILILYKLYEYKYIHVNIFKIYTCMFVYLSIHNKYTQHTHMYYVKNNFILDAVNRD